MDEDIFSIQEVFRFRRRGRDARGVILGDFETTGVRPKFVEYLAARGIMLPAQMFAPGRRST